MMEILVGSAKILLFAAFLALIAILIRRFTPIKNEPFRKLLHMILVIALMIWPYVFEHWYAAALASLLLAGVIYVALFAIEHFINFTQFMSERKRGEFRSSVILVFLMYAIVVAVCWGWRGDSMLATATVSAWGYGDAAAALIGKRFGRHFLEGKHIEGRKSVEGSLTMLCTSFVSVCIVLAIRGGMGWPAILLTALVTAAVTTIVELYSLHGNDTITCPLAAMVCLVPLTWLLGGML